MKLIRDTQHSLKLSSLVLISLIFFISGCVESNIISKTILKQSGDKNVIERHAVNDSMYFFDKGIGWSNTVNQARHFAKQNARKNIFDKVGKKIKMRFNTIYSNFDKKEQEKFFSFNYDLLPFVFGNIEKKLIYDDSNSYQLVRIKYKDESEVEEYKYFIIVKVERNLVNEALQLGIDEYFWQFFNKNEKTEEFYQRLKGVVL